MFRRYRLVPFNQPDGMPAMAGDGWASVNSRVSKLEERVDALASHVHEMDLKGMEHGEMLLRIAHLEKQMDDMPARVSNLEKYGSDVTIKLPDEIKEIGARVKDLEEKPKAQAEEERKRQNRVLVWTAVGGCAFMIASCMLTALGILISYLLTKGVI